MKSGATLARLAAALLAGLAGAAAAQAPEPRLPEGKQSHLEEGNLQVRAYYGLAVCALIDRRDKAEALLATDPGWAEEAALIEVIASAGETECPIRTRRATIGNKVLMRGAVAEALYIGDRRKPRAAGALPLGEAFQPVGAPTPAAVGRWVAKCAVRREPMLAHDVLRYNPGAIGETRALRALRPVLIACLPAAERLRASRINFRALIAEQLYVASLSFRDSFAAPAGRAGAARRD